MNYQKIAFSLALLLSFGVSIRSAEAQAQYNVVDLETLGGSDSYAFDVNESGHVVGYSKRANGYRYPFLWNGTMRDLGSLGSDGHDSGSTGIAYRINRSGTVVGWSGLATYPVTHAFRYQNGPMEDLGTMSPWPYSRATAINAAGQIVGSFDGTTPQNPVAPNFIWENSNFKVLPFLVVSTSMSPCAINDNGTVAGTAYFPTKTGAYTIKNNMATLLPLPTDATASEATSLNDQDDAVGNYTINGQVRPILWKNQVPIPLSLMPSTDDIRPQDINNAGVIVGYSQSSQHAYIYSNGTWTDLNNALCLSGNGWVLRNANAISDNGYIVGYGEHNGNTRAFLLVPNGVATPLDPNALRLTANDVGTPRDVAGIVCDNLSGMNENLKDRLDLILPGFPTATNFAWQLSSDNSNTNNTGYVKIATDGHLQYFPPDEYNDNQVPQNASNDITKSSLRIVTLTLTFTDTASGRPYLVTKNIYLARPPVVLVHGINSGPDRWSPFIQAIQNTTAAPVRVVNGVRMPFARVDHMRWKRGNGLVEVAAYELAQTIQTTLERVRQGTPLPGGAVDWIGFSYHPQDVAFEDYKDIRLSAKRVDIVAWSYGGVITRWYIASDGSDPSGLTNPNSPASWYKGMSEYLTDPDMGPVTVLPRYAGDIRKVITLGSMWRGVPLSNYLNEVIYAPSAAGLDFGSAPLNDSSRKKIAFANAVKKLIGKDPLGPGSNLRDLISIIGKFIPTRAPSMEVMAVNSPWLAHLIFDDPFQINRPLYARPFAPDIAYGSVSGYDAPSYPIFPILDFDFRDDIYQVLHEAQSPSFFPYLSLEFPIGGGEGFSDGLVPVWSSTIPGKDILLTGANHSAYPNDLETQKYVVRWLNNTNLPSGELLNDMWREPAMRIPALDYPKTWTFSMQAMAPLVQNEVYQFINGIGRIAPMALSAQSARPILVANLVGKPWRDGNDILMNVSVRNDGTVLAPTVSVRGTLTASTTTGLSLSVSAGTLAPGKLATVSLRFTPSTTGTGVWPVGASGSVRFTLASGYPGSEAGGNVGNGQRLVIP